MKPEDMDKVLRNISDEIESFNWITHPILDMR
jgi:hypothetical protein